MYYDGGFGLYYIIIYLASGGVFAWACSAVAKGKGKDGAVWGVLGFFLGLIGLIIIAIIPEEQGRSQSYESAIAGVVHRTDDSIRFVNPLCPIHILSTTIVVTDPEDQSYLTFEMKNMSGMEVKALKLCVKTYDSFWNPVASGGVVEFEALVQDLSVAPAQTFGHDKKVMLGAFYSARHIDVEILSIAFADGSVWECVNNPRIPVAERQTPDPELFTKLQTVAGYDVMCLAQNNEDYWICICGYFNPTSGDKCRNCQREKAMVLQDYSTHGAVETAFAQYVAQEAEKKAKEAVEAVRKKKKKIKIAVIATVAVATLFASIFGWDIFKEMQQIKLAEEKAMLIQEQADASSERLKELTADAKKGDRIYFGNFEQDGVQSNGREPIEWRVLAVDGDKKLLISDKCIDCQLYNTEDTGITWEQCTLRHWLNDDFISKAFTDEQQKAIALSSIVNEDNMGFSTYGGNDTQDKVFLLSIAEAEKYFYCDEIRCAKVTPFADYYGANVDDFNDMGWWWLRSPGIEANHAALVDCDGHINDSGDFIENLDGGNAVRPALWLDTNL